MFNQMDKLAIDSVSKYRDKQNNSANLLIDSLSRLPG